ncbi:MAG: Phosphate transport system permease protein PstC, partial [uncultured Chloroflexi bacterium]
ARHRRARGAVGRHPVQVGDDRRGDERAHDIGRAHRVVGHRLPRVASPLRLLLCHHLHLGQRQGAVRRAAVHLRHRRHQHHCAGPGGPRRGRRRTVCRGVRAPVDQDAGVVHHRDARRHPQHHLRPVGLLHPHADHALHHRAGAQVGARPYPGHWWAVPGHAHRQGPVHRRRHSGHHGPAYHHGGFARDHPGGASCPARGHAGAGRHAVGDHQQRGAAVRTLRHRGRRHPGPGTRAGRDHGGDDGHRQLVARHHRIGAHPWLHHGQRHRQPVHRGGHAHLLRGRGGGSARAAARLGRRQCHRPPVDLADPGRIWYSLVGGRPCL